VGNQGYAAQALNNQLCYCTTDQFEGHKFVQLIFLNWAKSDKAPDAPYLDGKAKFYVGLLRALTEIATTQNNEQGWAAYVHLARIRSNLILNSAIMLSYWGIGYRIGQGFYEANQRLYTKVGGERGNHNMLRMTRFLHTLVLFGYDILARRLYNDLLCHAQNPKSRSHYSKAIGGCPLAEFWRLDM
jgi:hypothetical protein